MRILLTHSVAYGIFISMERKEVTWKKKKLFSIVFPVHNLLNKKNILGKVNSGALYVLYK